LAGRIARFLSNYTSLIHCASLRYVSLNIESQDGFRSPPLPARHFRCPGQALFRFGVIATCSEQRRLLQVQQRWDIGAM